MKNILFVCSANKDRSKTAEYYFSEKYPNINFDSAGTNRKTCNQLGTNFLEEHQLEWADKIYVMENKHLRAIDKLFVKSYFKSVTVLNIPDVYKYGSKDLIELLKLKIEL
tara:strand:- start:41960 stop:42289 length:330 start_codon:yes stop_codon:yes gene_type:complete